MEWIDSQRLSHWEHVQLFPVLTRDVSCTFIVMPGGSLQSHRDSSALFISLQDRVKNPAFPKKYPASESQ